jgi:hypothetical protein|nr:MAG TPA: hypothetical protein [Caudoviricetes sp.]
MEKIVSMKAIIKSEKEKLEFVTSVYELREEKKIFLEFHLTDNDLIHTKVSNVIDRDKSHSDLLEEIENILDIFMNLSGNSLLNGVIHKYLFSRLISNELITRRPMNNEGFYFNVDSPNFREAFYDAFYVKYEKGLKSVEFESPSGKRQIIILTSKTESEERVFYFQRSK